MKCRGFSVITDIQKRVVQEHIHVSLMGMTARPSYVSGGNDRSTFGNINIYI